MSNSIYFGAPVSTNQPANTRLLQDGNTNTYVATPAQGVTAYSPYIDLRQDVTYSTSELLNIYVSIPAQSATGGTAGGTLQLVIQAAPDSAAAGTPDAGPTVWTTIATFANPLLTSTDTGGTTPDANATLKLSLGVNRYLRIQVVASGTAGTTPSGNCLLQVNY
jgi:hypothetical protein